MATHNNDIWVQDGDEKRKLEGQELIDYKANIALTIAEVEAAKAAQEKKDADRQALLARLGITEDEAQLLLS